MGLHSLKHYHEKTQVFWEVVLGIVCVSILGYLGWLMVSSVEGLGWLLLGLWSIFVLAWVGPELWKEFIGWIQRRCFGEKH